MKFDINKKDYPGNVKKYTFRFSLTGLIGLGSVFTIGLVWVFIFGVLVGRGYRPENSVPELARIMPPEQANRSELSEMAKVLRPEELQFYDNLKENKRAAEPEAKEKTAPPEKAARKAETPAAKPPKTALKPAAPAKPAPEKPKQAAPPQKAGDVERIVLEPAGQGEKKADKSVQSAGQGMFSYIYQVAAVGNKDSALRFRDKVRALGLDSEVKTSSQGGRTWHRVLVYFKGRPEDTREMKEKLKSLGVEKPIMNDKRPL